MTFRELTAEQLTALYNTAVAEVRSLLTVDQVTAAFTELWEKNPPISSERSVGLVYRVASLRRRTRLKWDRRWRVLEGQSAEGCGSGWSKAQGRYVQDRGKTQEPEALRRVLALEVLDALPPVTKWIAAPEYKLGGAYTDVTKQGMYRWRGRAKRVLAGKGLDWRL